MKKKKLIIITIFILVVLSTSLFLFVNKKTNKNNNNNKNKTSIKEETKLLYGKKLDLEKYEIYNNNNLIEDYYLHNDDKYTFAYPNTLRLNYIDYYQINYNDDNLKVINSYSIINNMENMLKNTYSNSIDNKKYQVEKRTLKRINDKSFAILYKQELENSYFERLKIYLYSDNNEYIQTEYILYNKRFSEDIITKILNNIKVEKKKDYDCEVKEKIKCNIPYLNTQKQHFKIKQSIPNNYKMITTRNNQYQSHYESLENSEISVTTQVYYELNGNVESSIDQTILAREGYTKENITIDNSKIIKYMSTYSTEINYLLLINNRLGLLVIVNSERNQDGIVKDFLDYELVAS